ncbi:MAG: hypothetical protein WC783_02890 [Candidatus Paceibacterota bacterium]|jgi:hypothetical protein
MKICKKPAYDAIEFDGENGKEVIAFSEGGVKYVKDELFFYDDDRLPWALKKGDVVSKIENENGVVIMHIKKEDFERDWIKL